MSLLQADMVVVFPLSTCHAKIMVTAQLVILHLHSGLISPGVKICEHKLMVQGSASPSRHSCVNEEASVSVSRTLHTKLTPLNMNISKPLPNMNKSQYFKITVPTFQIPNISNCPFPTFQNSLPSSQPLDSDWRLTAHQTNILKQR